MDCRNHPGTAAAAACAGCAEAYCTNCLVEVRGARYCASCKGMAITGPGPGLAPPLPPGGGIPCAEAGEALKYAIVGLFCLGIVLEPYAIWKGLEARKKIASNPGLTGGGKATAAIAIGSIVLALWVIGIAAKLAGKGRY